MAVSKAGVRLGLVAELDLGSDEYEIRGLLRNSASGFAVDGALVLDGKEFRASYLDLEHALVVVGVFDTPDGNPVRVDLKTLATAVSPEIGEVVPSIEVSIGAAAFAIVKRKAHSGSQTDAGSSDVSLIFGVEFGAAIDLAELPLVGPKLAGGQKARLDGLKILASSTALEGDVLTALRESLVGTGFAFGDPDLTSFPAGPVVAAKLQMGDAVHPLVLPLVMPAPPALPGTSQPSPKAKSKQLQPKSKAPVARTEAVLPASPRGGQAGSGTKWFDLNKTFGPVNVGRVGFKMGAGELTLLVDAGMRLGPLEFGLAGLGVTNPLSRFDPSFELAGLALGYKAGGVEISGGLLYDKAQGAFIGQAKIKTPALTITALGGYQKVNGKASLFIYAVLDSPLGGPAFFFVTGLALGFGYNRGLVLPEAEAVPQFPFVIEAIGGTASPAPTPIQKLRELQRVVPARQGEMFFAVGIKFTSFKLLDSFVLLIVRLGDDLIIDLLGVSRVSVPPSIGAPITPVAQAELAIRATVNVTKGTILVRGVLTDNSFVLSRSCQLTGGFAFAAWLSGERAGDFVVTLGGYHPDYKVPAHYPQVPRVGLRWRVTRELSVKGGIYMALTPQCVMAGGEFAAVYSSGSIRASFGMKAHFIISWQPYFYRAEMSATFRFNYRIRVDLGWFGTIDETLSFNVSAGLKVWGPEFGGTAHVSVSVVSFDVDFGSRRPRVEPISWSEFETAFLPSRSERLTLLLTEGVLREGADLPIVSGVDFAMELNCAVPIIDRAASGARTSFGVAPMNRAKVNESTHRIEVLKDGAVFDEFLIEPILKSGPSAMWGSTMASDVDGDALLKNLVMGYRFKPAPTISPDVTASRPVSDFAFDEVRRPKAFYFYEPPAVDEFRQPVEDLVRDATKVATVKRRAAILDSLGLDHSMVSLEAMKEEPLAVFTKVPWTVR